MKYAVVTFIVNNIASNATQKTKTKTKEETWKARDMHIYELGVKFSQPA